MKLSEQQIQIIETALIEKCEFHNFDDVRIELVDHIATEIEAEIETDNLTFESAFVKVMHRWNPIILPKSWSRYENVPYIVCELWKKLDWKYNYSSIPLTLLIGYVLLQFKQEKVAAFAMYGIAFIGVLVGIYLIKLQRSNQFNTVLSMYAGMNLYYIVFLLILGIGVNFGLNIYDGDYASTPVLWVIVHCTIILIFRTILMRKNITIENQLLKVSS